MNKKQKNILIVGLLGLVLIMAIGYAAFATNLNIGGTAETTSTWNIRITNIKAVDLASINGVAIANNGAYDVTAPTYDNTNGLTATFSTGLTSPGDTRVYEVEVSNLGSINADITKTLTNNSNNPAIEFTYDGVSSTSVLSNAGAYTKSSLSTTEPFSLPATTNNVKYVYVTVKYSDSVEGQPSSTTGSMTLTLNAVQEGNSSGGSGGDTPASNKVYAINTSSITKDTSTLTDIGTTYSSCAETGKSSCLRYTIENDVVTGAEVCFVKGGTEYCLQGWADECLWDDDADNGNGACTFTGTPTIFNANKSVLQSAFTEANACTDNGSDFYCDASGLGAGAESYGNVGAGAGSWGCGVSSDDNSGCYVRGGNGELDPSVPNLNI